MGKPFDFMIHKLCKQILSKVAALPDNIAAVKTAVADVAKYVTTNNTANKTGILSQKITYLINQNEAHGSLQRTTVGSQNWVCPAGVHMVYVIASGGAGGGGGGGFGKASYWKYGTPGRGGSAGGLGAVLSGVIPVTPGTTYQLVVGAGGTAGTAGTKASKIGGNGGNGGDTKLGSILIATGGKGGKGGGSGDGNDNSIVSAPTGGGASDESAKFTFLGVLLNIIGAMRSSATLAKTYSYANDGKGVRTGPGGSALTNGLEIKSGAGGAGGKVSISESGGNLAEEECGGSAGGAGTAGKIYLVW